MRSRSLRFLWFAVSWAIIPAMLVKCSHAVNEDMQSNMLYIEILLGMHFQHPTYDLVKELLSLRLLMLYSGILE